MKILSRHIYIWIILSAFGCIEPFDPNIPNTGNSFLVVNGRITDQPGPYTVSLSLSSEINGEVTVALGASLSIEEKDGITETLTATEPGIYQTSSLQGETGKSYRLLIDYEGKQYASTWETINDSPKIDSVYYEIETKLTTDIDNDVEGVQFYIDSRGSQDGTKYFRYVWEETWRIGVKWPAFYDYIGNDVFVLTKEPRYTCWKYENSSNINIATTNGLSENFLSKHPLGFIQGDDQRFAFRHSTLIKQFALSEKEYRFWENLQESNEKLGNLFDRQPAKVIGNISGIENSNDIVLGYFSAYGVQEQRIFIRSSDVPSSLIERAKCTPLDTLFKSELLDNYETILLRELKSKTFYNLYYRPMASTPSGALLSDPNCSDCTRQGGDLNKPDFWDD